MIENDMATAGAMPVRSELWVDYWRTRGRSTAHADEHTQVGHTTNKRPISAEGWRLILEDIKAKFPVGPQDDLLELCCGNGLCTGHIGGPCRSVLSVDVSPDLLAKLDKKCLPNVKTLCGDVRLIRFPEGAFSRILLYNAIQYLSEGEAVELFREMFRWLRPGGLLLVGDIPDRSRLWSFYNTPERRRLYFENCIIDRDAIGTWFDGEWLVQLSQSAGFQSAKVIPQPPGLSYAHFRFDLSVIR